MESGSDDKTWSAMVRGPGHCGSGPIFRSNRRVRVTYNGQFRGPSRTTPLVRMTVAAENLPAMIDRAASRLSAARTSDELLEARQIAQSALHFAKVTKAAKETACPKLSFRSRKFAAVCAARRDSGEDILSSLNIVST
jgi:hypothetical protein